MAAMLIKCWMGTLYDQMSGYELVKSVSIIISPDVGL